MKVSSSSGGDEVEEVVDEIVVGEGTKLGEGEEEPGFFYELQGCKVWELKNLVFSLVITGTNLETTMVSEAQSGRPL